MHTTRDVVPSRMRLAMLGTCLALLFSGAYALSSSAPSAQASELHICTAVNLGYLGWCEDSSYRWVTRSWGRSENGNSVCVTAWNSSGGTPGGSVCAASRTFISNGNFNGSLLLKAGIWNNIPGSWDVFYGRVNYNP